jgi:hypothetical protein
MLYVIALEFDLALFTVYPAAGGVLLGARPSGDTIGPAMHWYGVTATTALGALIFGVVAASLPDRWTYRMWSGWLWMAPVAAMIACVYLSLPWFRF